MVCLTSYIYLDHTNHQQPTQSLLPSLLTSQFDLNISSKSINDSSTEQTTTSKSEHDSLTSDYSLSASGHVKYSSAMSSSGSTIITPTASLLMADSPTGRHTNCVRCSPLFVINFAQVKHSQPYNGGNYRANRDHHHRARPFHRHRAYRIQQQSVNHRHVH
jgi:hypothetical protein